jgi:thiamine biosynthesis lipoprotein
MNAVVGGGTYMRDSKRSLGFAAATALLVVACSGGGGATTAPTTVAAPTSGTPATAAPGTPSAELDAVRPVVGYDNVLLDTDAHTVRFRRAGVELDLGGIAKGFAVELAAGVLRAHALGGSIDAGGNQYLLGPPPGKSAWEIGIKNPDTPEALLGVLDVDGGSVSTSAQYANSLRSGARRYGHVLDPRSADPVNGSQAAAVVGPSAADCEALSTALLVLGPSWLPTLAERFPGYRGWSLLREPLK